MTRPKLEDGDVPYGDDWQDAGVVAAWFEAADRKRAWRAQIRAFIADQVAALAPGARVLELGAGPGLLAECVLEQSPAVASYTLLDFSADMLAIGRERLARYRTARFVLASFKSPDWVEQVDRPFDCVLSMQAVHELRNKRHAPALYRQIHQVAADHPDVDIAGARAAGMRTIWRRDPLVSRIVDADARIEEIRDLLPLPERPRGQAPATPAVRP